jgi:hypothetical protein
VYRETAGRWTKANARLIPARSGLVSSSYRFVDRGARGASRYRLQVVAIDGSRVWRGVTKAR